jgi:integrase
MTSAKQSTTRSTAPSPKRDPNTGTWRFVFDSIHPNPDGSRRQVYRRGFAKRAEAKAELNRLRHEDAELIAPADGTLTVGMVLDSFIRAKRLAGKARNTVAQYEWAADQAKARWGGWAADKLTQDHLEGAYAEMLVGGRRQWHRGQGTKLTGTALSRRSVQVVHKTVKAAFQLAVDKGQLVQNPARLVAVAGDKERAERPHWTAFEVGRFLDFMATCADLPAGMVEVMADTGARVGEVTGLHWSDVNLTKATVSIVGQLVPDPEDTSALSFGPTKRPRAKSTVALHPDTVTALRRRKVEQAEDRLKMGSGWPGAGVAVDLVFTWADGTAMNPKTVSRIIGRLSVTAGLPRITAHGLRHSFATAALEARVPVEVVAARLGNTARMVQEVYQHAIPAEDAAAPKLVGDLYRAGRKA